jgi:hypothetical protein
MTDDWQTAAALPAELATTMRQAGIDPRLAGRVLEVALHRAIAARGGSCTWSKVDAE